MASPKEKLTIIPPLSIRLTESLKRDIDGLAELHGMEKSEYIRHLVEQDKLEQHRIWLQRNSLFATLNARASESASDNG